MPWPAASSLGSWLGAETAGASNLDNLAHQLVGATPETIAWLIYQMSHVAPPTDSPRGGHPRDDSGGIDYGALWRWATSSIQHQDPQQKPPAQQPQPPANVSGLKLPSGADAATVSAVIRAAQEVGVDPALALAIAYRESGLTNPLYSDNQNSFGPFQLNASGGEGTGLPFSVLSDPYQSSKIALQQIKQIHDQHPDWSAGQIGYAAQRPNENYKDVYTSDINRFFDSITTGSGELAGLNPVAAGRAQSRNQPGSNTTVPLPFPSDAFYKSRTETFHQTPGELGNDFAMDPGTQITSPVGGTIHLVDDGQANWGKRVFVKTPSGWTFAVGHMHSFAVEEGQTVGANQVLGLSGGAIGDPSSGVTTGPHIEVQFIDPSGNYVDPDPILQQLYKGVNYNQWWGGVFQSSSQVQGQQQDLHWTPDKQLVDYNSAEGQWYQTVNNAWTSIYGQHAPMAAAMAFKQAGITTADQLQNAMNQLPSSISGMTIGQYHSLNSQLQTMIQQRFGRAAPQSLLSEMYHQGITTQSDMTLWFDSHSSADIPPDQYQAAYDAAAPYTQGVWGDAPHPTDVTAAVKAAGG